MCTHRVHDFDMPSSHLNTLCRTLRTASGSLTNLSHVNEPPFINVQTPSLIRDRVIEPSFTLLSLCSLTRLEPRYRG